MKKLFGRKQDELGTNNKKKFHLERTNTHTIRDKEGNTIHYEEDVIFKTVKNTQPHYFQTYTQHLDGLNTLTKQENNIIRRLADLADFESSIINLNSSIKKQIIKTLEIELKTFDNILLILKKKQVLFHLDKSVFVLNPFYFGKGAWTDQLELRKAIKITKTNDQPYKFDYSNLVIAYKDTPKKTDKVSCVKTDVPISKEQNDNHSSKKINLTFLERLKFVFFSSKKYPKLETPLDNKQVNESSPPDNDSKLH
ncbi:hypothetical protein [Colwellia psychrerythraea]|uniref:Plasmid replication protein RepL domain-containing protein n=1 Tax=Colwellia psychrerythraea (strain 34H / ATCC BAA-681) TaxID=167879 RepID=Q489L1_COLP3|nr:hypothetical protein [Colwellia psychrerythraea]AAZ27680.1 hypothetical protein CPS_0495 [Colwellia psychrerythraea 34H]